MKNWHKRINQAGDTIVEVLIATAVVSSVLAGAFLVSQKSTIAVRDSQEHGEMLQVLQGQVELVRAMALVATDDSSGVFDGPPTAAQYFCINGTDPASPARVDFPLTFDTTTYAGYPPECSDIQTRYNVTITYDSSSHVFSFSGRWDKLSGGQNQEQLSYRMYPGAVPSVINNITPGDVAVVTNSPCQKDPITHACITGSGPVDYQWTSYITNVSPTPSSPIVSCVWKWSDGLKQTDKCAIGDFQKHTWSKPVGYPPYDYLCASDHVYKGNVTLTLTLANGSKPTTTYTVPYPLCYPD